VSVIESNLGRFIRGMMELARSWRSGYASKIILVQHHRGPSTDDCARMPQGSIKGPTRDRGLDSLELARLCRIALTACCRRQWLKSCDRAGVLLENCM